MTIPINNIYYLLCYAWKRLEEGRVVDVSGVSESELVNLFARVLIGGTRHLLRRGLDRNYISKHETLSCLRGRVDFEESNKRMLLHQASAACVFDELSHNILHNQILRSTIRRLIGIDVLDRELRAELAGIDRYLIGISIIRLDRRAFSRLQLHRNNAFYGFLMDICDFIHRNILVNEASGTYRFKDFLRDEAQMAALFEAFVLNFYQIECPELHVKSEQIRWDADHLGNEEDLSWLPTMNTDISIRSESLTTIIDTKYYKEMFQTNYEKRSIRSSHLYQIYAYLRNLERNNGPDAHAEGILLYPAVNENVRLDYRIAGHAVHIRTLDLSQDWRSIHDQLTGMVANHYAALSRG